MGTVAIIEGYGKQYFVLHTKRFTCFLAAAKEENLLVTGQPPNPCKRP